MRKMRGSWFAAALVLAVFAGVVYLQANAQTPPERQPLITEALVDAENGTLTINGYDFAGEVPTVTLGMATLPVLSVTEWGVVTGLPELLPGTYLLAVSWTDGAGAVFYPTLGAVGPAGPQGPQGEPGPFLSTGSTSPSAPMAYGGDAAVDGDPTSSPDHAGASNTHFGSRALESVTTGIGNTAFGQNTIRFLTEGVDNAGFGRNALYRVTTGSRNLALGTTAMQEGTEASANTAIGTGALRFNQTGQNNVAIGAEALFYNLGDGNLAIGGAALRGSRDISTGSNNTALGFQAGRRNHTGSNNVYINSPGELGEEGVIRIGDPDTHTKTYLAGEVVGNIVPVYQ